MDIWEDDFQFDSPFFFRFGFLEKSTKHFWMFFCSKNSGDFLHVFGWALDLTLQAERKTQSAAAIQDAVQSCVISEESKHRFVP